MIVKIARWSFDLSVFSVQVNTRLLCAFFLMVTCCSVNFAQINKSDQNRNESGIYHSVILFIEPVADICLNANAIPQTLMVTIQGGDGSGIGVWSGTGVVPPNSFDPNLANPGPNIITYTFVENGFVYIETITINVTSPPSSNFNLPSSICQGDTTAVFASYADGSTYSWDFSGADFMSGSGPGVYQVSWETEGNYPVTLVVTDSIGCSSDPFTQTINVNKRLEAPEINCTTSNSMITFDWEDVDGALGYSVNVLQGNPGIHNGNSYLVSPLNENDTVTIELHILGNFPCEDISITQTCVATNCQNINIDLEAVPDICFSENSLPLILTAIVDTGSVGNGIWSGNGITDSIAGIFDPQDPQVEFGENIITFTFLQDGCFYNEQLPVYVHQSPEINMGFGGEISCAVSEIALNTSIIGTNLSIQWTGGNIISGANTSNPIVNQPGWYYLQVTDTLSGCSSADSVFISKHPDLPQAFAGPDGKLTCALTSFSLQSNGSTTGTNIQYTWTGIDSAQMHSQNPEVYSSGTYILTITDTLNNCSSVPDTAIVTIDTLSPEAIITNPLDSVNCQILSQFLLGMEVPDAIYKWVNQNDSLIGITPEIEVNNYGIYYFHVIDTLNGCIGKDTIKVEHNVVYPYISIAFPDDLNCNNTVVTLNANESQSGNEIIIEWSGPPGGFSGPPDDLTTSVVLPGIYTLTLRDTVNRCENEKSVLVNQNLDPPKAITNNPNELDCETLTASMNGSASSGMGTLEFEWVYNSNIVSQNAYFSAVNPGSYMLVVTDGFNGCSDTTIVDVFERTEKISSALLDIQDPSCHGDTDASIDVIEVNGGSLPFQYQLNSEEFSDIHSFQQLSPGEYSLSIIDQENCTWDTIITILDPPELTLDIGNQITLQLGEEAIITALTDLPVSQIDTLIWAPMEILSCIDSVPSSCNIVSALPLQNQVVFATLTDKNGCSVRDELLLLVKKDRIVFIPNLFTPNGDTQNDIFMIFGSKSVEKVNHFYVYDRWGEVMYEGHDFLPNDPSYGWNGKRNNKLLNPGVFVYWAEVQLLDGQTLIYKGDVTLLR